jgi:hypothetical protein
MTSLLLETMHELDSRNADGLHVRLLWREHDGRVAVVVTDRRTGDEFAIDVRDGESALDVFHHPYAYAAWRGVGTRTLQPA